MSMGKKMMENGVPVQPVHAEVWGDCFLFAEGDRCGACMNAAWDSDDDWGDGQGYRCQLVGSVSIWLGRKPLPDGSFLAACPHFTRK
jgi:hypothetical protein